MALPPRRIRQLPPALPAKPTDVFPVSQMDDAGNATTRAMTREQFQSDITDFIATARQDFVNQANEEHARLDTRDDDLQRQIDENRTSDEDIESIIAMLQEQIANGSGGKNAYQLWLELPGNSGKSLSDFLEAYRGATGSTGPQGAPGIQGDVGPVGPMGPSGTQGPTGATGDQGLRGEAGPQGAKGDTGSKGDVGLTGPQGAVGPKGDAGPKGDVGPQGPKGDTGPQGVKGDTGPAGKFTLVGTATISETMLVSLSLGVQRKSVTMSGVTTADNGKLLAVLNGTPTAGCELYNVIVTAANTLSLGIFLPTLGIGATYSVPIAIYRIA